MALGALATVVRCSSASTSPGTGAFGEFAGAIPGGIGFREDAADVVRLQLTEGRRRGAPGVVDQAVAGPEPLTSGSPDPAAEAIRISIT
jgi:hypothetical protein